MTKKTKLLLCILFALCALSAAVAGLFSSGLGVNAATTESASVRANSVLGGLNAVTIVMLAAIGAMAIIVGLLMFLVLRQKKEREKEEEEYMERRKQYIREHSRARRPDGKNARRAPRPEGEEKNPPKSEKTSSEQNGEERKPGSSVEERKSEDTKREATPALAENEESAPEGKSERSPAAEDIKSEKADTADGNLEGEPDSEESPGGEVVDKDNNEE